MNLADFFTPEAGQARTAWLNRQDKRAADALDYYLGPTGIPDRVRAVGDLAWLFSPAGDVREMYDQSGNLVRAGTPMEAATAATAFTAAAGSVFIPGNARAIAEGLENGGDLARMFARSDDGALKLPGFGDGTVYRSEAPVYEHPGAGAVFYSPDMNYVQNYVSPERVLRSAVIPEGTLDIRDPATARQILDWLGQQRDGLEDLYFDGRLPGIGNELRQIERNVTTATPGDADVAQGLANLGLIRWRQGQPRVSGLAERELLDAFGAPAMTMRESDGSPSLAFRTPEIARQNWLAPK